MWPSEQQMRRLPKLQPFVKVYKARNSRSMQLAVALLHVCVAFARHRQTNAGQHSDAKIELESMSISPNYHLARIMACLIVFVSSIISCGSKFHIASLRYLCFVGLVSVCEGLQFTVWSGASRWRVIPSSYRSQIRTKNQEVSTVPAAGRGDCSSAWFTRPEEQNPRQSEDWKQVLSCTVLRWWALMKCQLYKKYLA